MLASTHPLPSLLGSPTCRHHQTGPGLLTAVGKGLARNITAAQMQGSNKNQEDVGGDPVQGNPERSFLPEPNPFFVFFPI